MELNDIEKLAKLIAVLKEKQKNECYQDVEVKLLPSKNEVVFIRSCVGLTFLKWLISNCESLNLNFFMDFSKDIPDHFEIHCFPD